MRARASWARALAALLVLAGAAALVAWLQLERVMQRPGEAAAAQRIVVPARSSLRGVLRRLEAAGLLPSATAAELWLRLRRAPVRLAVGTYEFAPHASPAEVLEQLISGRTMLEEVTIVEGWTFADMRRALDAHPQLSHDWQRLGGAELMAQLGAPGLNPEGRFFPDTYRFSAGTSDRRLYRLAFTRMQQELAAAWASRAPDLPVHTEDEALVLASIIEKETGRADERGKVAAVFVNRLRAGMRLQSDPTVIYGVGAAYDGNIRTRDLQTDTPYNTYTRAGLPPTPIALPGAASLHAAMHPDPTNALFFVATGLGDGSHHFSATLAEHNAAVQRFLQRMGQARSLERSPAAGGQR
jgi:UPF0755 protein